jgi:hypothetical protein
MYGTKSSADNHVKNSRKSLAAMLKKTNIPDEEITANLGLYMERMHLSRLLLMHKLYKKIINVPGNIIEFGVRWGQNIALFNSFRGMYEPYNYTRRIIGFDTFSGFPSVNEKDNNKNTETPTSTSEGDYSVSEGWENDLDDILKIHESLSPLPHLKKYELIKGDVTSTFDSYLDSHPEMIVSMAYFDFDIYEPTKMCLEALMPRLTKGSIVVFDELNCPEFPGETLAVQEILGTKTLALKRDPNNPYVSWFINK